MYVAQIGQELLNVPMGDMIRQMAFAVADAQLQLDQSAVQVAELMSGTRVIRNEDGSPKLGTDSKVQTYDSRVYFGNDAAGQPTKLSMIELGFTPNFYQFIDTVIEVKIALKINLASDQSVTSRANATSYGTSWNHGWGWSSSTGNTRTVATATSVDAAYSARYNYAAEGSSVLRTKLVPVPPPAILEERIRQIQEQRKAAENP